MSLPAVHVVVLNWNGKADTLECLASLQKDAYANKRIIVVDNGSTDDSAAQITAAFPEATLLQTGANLGFTGGNNAGIRHALALGCDFVFLLNNDTTVEPTAISELVKAAQSDAHWGILTPVIHYFDRPDDVWFGGSSLDLARGRAVHDNSRIPARDEPPVQLPWTTGCAMFLRADVVRQLEGFDDRFFLLWEDVDLSLRARAAHFSIGLVPAARIYHKVSRSIQGISARSTYYYLRNHLLLLSKHGGCGRLQAIAARCREALRQVRSRRAGSWDQCRAIAMALRDTLLHRYGPLAPHICL